MSQVVVHSPLKELELSDEDGLQPYALGHLRLREPLAPSSTSGLWKIGKRTLVDLKPPELLEQLRTRDGREWHRGPWCVPTAARPCPSHSRCLARRYPFSGAEHRAGRLVGDMRPTETRRRTAGIGGLERDAILPRPIATKRGAHTAD